MSRDSYVDIIAKPAKPNSYVLRVVARTCIQWRAASGTELVEKAGFVLEFSDLVLRTVEGKLRRVDLCVRSKCGATFSTALAAMTISNIAECAGDGDFE